MKTISHRTIMLSNQYRKGRGGRGGAVEDDGNVIVIRIY